MATFKETHAVMVDLHKMGFTDKDTGASKIALQSTNQSSRTWKVSKHPRKSNKLQDYLLKLIQLLDQCTSRAELSQVKTSEVIIDKLSRASPIFSDESSFWLFGTSENCSSGAPSPVSCHQSSPWHQLCVGILPSRGSRLPHNFTQNHSHEWRLLPQHPPRAASTINSSVMISAFYRIKETFCTRQK